MSRSIVAGKLVMGSALCAMGIIAALVSFSAFGGVAAPDASLVPDSEAANIWAGGKGSKFYAAPCYDKSHPKGCTSQTGFYRGDPITPGKNSTWITSCGGSCGDVYEQPENVKQH